jgi:hypothetical protein
MKGVPKQRVPAFLARACPRSEIQRNRPHPAHVAPSLRRRGDDLRDKLPAVEIADGTARPPKFHAVPISREFRATSCRTNFPSSASLILADCLTAIAAREILYGLRGHVGFRPVSDLSQRRKPTATSFDNRTESRYRAIWDHLCVCQSSFVMIAEAFMKYQIACDRPSILLTLV